MTLEFVWSHIILYMMSGTNCGTRLLEEQKCRYDGTENKVRLIDRIRHSRRSLRASWTKRVARSSDTFGNVVYYEVADA